MYIKQLRLSLQGKTGPALQEEENKIKIVALRTTSNINAVIKVHVNAVIKAVHVCVSRTETHSRTCFDTFLAYLHLEGLSHCHSCLKISVLL